MGRFGTWTVNDKQIKGQTKNKNKRTENYADLKNTSPSRIDPQILTRAITVFFFEWGCFVLLLLLLPLSLQLLLLLMLLMLLLMLLFIFFLLLL